MSSSEDSDEEIRKLRENPLAGLEDDEISSSSEENEEEEESTDSDVDTSDEEEDDDADLVTPRITNKVMETIDRIRKKDPAVYTKDQKFFSSDDEDVAPKAKKEKPLHLVDYKKEFMLQREGHVASDSESEDEPVVTHAEEQRKLKQAFLESAAGIDADEDESGGLTLRKKTAQELTKEKTEVDALRELQKSDDAVDKYLFDYVLNERWKDSKKGTVPTYEEVVEQRLHDRQDRHHIDEMESFESTYNFRFEEDGGTNIITHPRGVQSARREVDKRKESRKKKHEADVAEAEQKEDERQARLAAVIAELEDPKCTLSEREKKARYLEAFVESLPVEDEVEGVKVPFAYTEVRANSYGMKARDILEASDSELDEYVPIKKMAPYAEREWKPMFTKKPQPAWKKKLESRSRQGDAEEGAAGTEGDVDTSVASAQHADKLGSKHKKDKQKHKSGKEQLWDGADSVAVGSKRAHGGAERSSKKVKS